MAEDVVYGGVQDKDVGGIETEPGKAGKRGLNGWPLMSEPVEAAC